MESEEVKIYKIFNDENPFLWEKFGIEFRDEFQTPSCVGSWKDFINSKNLGIECRREHGNNNSKYIYLIIDEKKWTYNRIKLEV
jgi:hypothetical protein